MRRFNYTLHSPVGWIGIGARGKQLSSVAILPGRPRCDAPNELAERAGEALQAYFAGAPLPELPLADQGTVFQRQVWRALRDIPKGQHRTYGDIARELGTAPRAVGGACRANPWLLFVPCHRVVSATGQGGFAGHSSGTWPAIKRWLLAHEAADA